MKTPILLIAFLLFAVNLFSHPADNLVLKFDPIENILTITANHAVKDIDDHYIDEIIVKLNKKEIISQNFQKQDSLMEATALYKIIDAKVGDTITVITKCNKFGKKTDKILVPALQTDNEE